LSDRSLRQAWFESQVQALSSSVQALHTSPPM
jgi:hypothetical protein